MKWDNWNTESMGFSASAPRRRPIKPADPAKLPDKETLGRWESEGGPDPDAIVEPGVTDIVRAKVGAAKMAVVKAVDAVRKLAEKTTSGDHDGH